MKNLIALFLLTTLFSKTADAGCVGTRFVVSSSAAVGTMVSGYQSRMAYLKADELLYLAKEISYTGVGAHYQVGDRITVHYYNRSEELKHFRAQLAAADNQLSILKIFDAKEWEIRKQERTVERFRQAVTQLEHGGHPRIVYTKEFTHPRAATNFIAQVKRGGNSLSMVSVITQKSLRDVAKASRRGWVLLGTAIALGLVASEEAVSGKISCLLESELKGM